MNLYLDMYFLWHSIITVAMGLKVQEKSVKMLKIQIEWLNLFVLRQAPKKFMFFCSYESYARLGRC